MPVTASSALPAQSMLMPYSQRSPGSKASGRQSSGCWKVCQRGMPARVHVGQHVGVPHVVDEAGGMGEQVAERDRPPRRAQLGLALGVEALEHARPGQRRHDAAEIGVEVEAALLDQLHAGSAGDRLGHRGDREDGVERHRRRLAERAPAEGALVGDAAAVGRHGDHARHRAGGDGALEGLVDALLGWHVGSNRQRAFRSVHGARASMA